MDVNQTITIMPKHQDHRNPKQAVDHHSNSDKENKDNQKSGSWREHEAVDMEQSWIGAFTPEVQSIIDTLRCEIEPLRHRLSLAEQRTDEFKELAAQHVFLNSSNRRETIRKINHVIAHKAEFPTPPILILLHVVNADQVRCELGRLSLDQYLAEICERLLQSISETDVFGSICGNDFSLLMLGADRALAKLAVDQLIAQVCKDPIVINNIPITIKFLTGAADLSHIQDGEAAIALADQNMDKNCFIRQ
jgi:GGDEF domain-containing protein